MLCHLNFHLLLKLNLTYLLLGIKLDACPGRLSQASLFIKRPGFFYGQCSEICGVNHAFMPISIRSVPYRTFMT